MKFLLTALIIFLSTSCTVYRSNGIFYASNANLGIVTSENVQNAASLAPGVSAFSSQAGGQRVVASTETAETPSIAFADGTVMTGTVDHTSFAREVGNVVKNVNIIRAVKSIWTTGLEEIQGWLAVDRVP